MDKKRHLLTYDDISDLIEELSGKCTSEELHGVVSGQIAAGQALSDRDWLKGLLEFIDAEEKPSTIINRELKELVENVQNAMSDPELGFQLMLPQDEEPLRERAKGLGCWCQGFLAGFGLATTKSREDIGDEVEEILSDLASISQVDIEDEETEANEENFFVLVEYVRMAALNIYMESQVPGEGEAPSPQLH